MDIAKTIQSPLRKLRLARKLKLHDVVSELQNLGNDISVSYLSLIERGGYWPNKDIVDGLITVFNGEITEMEILYPEQFEGESNE